MPLDIHILKTLTSFFYDLVKAVPAATLNEALINTILVDRDGNAVEVTYCDEELRRWAEEFARQLIDYELKFKESQVSAMRENGKTYVDHPPKHEGERVSYWK